MCVVLLVGWLVGCCCGGDGGVGGGGGGGGGRRRRRRGLFVSSSSSSSFLPSFLPFPSLYGTNKGTAVVGL